MMGQEFTTEELLELAAAHGIEINENHEPRPRYLSREQLHHHRIVLGMPNDEYHSHRKSLSSSILKKATTPILYAKYLREGFSIKDNACLIIGTALHSMLLEQDNLASYVIYNESELLEQVKAMRPEVKSLKSTKEWKELIAPYLKEDGSGHFLDNVMNAEQFDGIETEAQRLKNHPTLFNLYQGAKSEASFFAEFNDIDVRIRPDLFKIADKADASTFEGVEVGDAIIMSVKTTIDASPRGFARECRKMDYLLAEAFYHDVLCAILEKRVHVMMLAVEKDAKQVLSGQTMLYRLTKEHIEQGRNHYEPNLEVVLEVNHALENGYPLEGYEFHNNGSIILTLQ